MGWDGGGSCTSGPTGRVHALYSLKVMRGQGVARGRSPVERLAAINVSKDAKTVTLNDALLDRPEGIVVSHAPAAAAYVTHRRRRAVLYNDINQHIC